MSSSVQADLKTRLPSSKEIRKKQEGSIGKVLSNILLVIATLFFLFPFYWIVTGAFKKQTVATAIPPEWFPVHPTLENWTQLFKNPVWRWTLNSFIVSCGEMIAICLVASLAGYVLAKKFFPGRKLIFGLFVGAMALPKQVILVPLFTMLADFGWVNTYHGLILPAIGWPFGVFLMKQFSQTIPSEVLEASRIDGCSEVRMFSTIILPLLTPALGALAIFTFIGSWNDYFSQLIMTRSTSMMTLPLGIATLQGEFTTDYGIMMAGAALASVPMILIFLVFQKAFTQGITMGAVKG
ncbi:multiple sugar transport system permease protein [Paenibacillus shirakamiensis]|uniref:Multiple sugar transport system permease protein n=1 Tax=Paenibacillus shirakamiensis TaxID=1265935 RepID=A0ABS4JM85_9BACL|nr:carbohydrate ABC transporter permease [Paenibacillus shirakamiensis]MBP2002225.1 multiple sugar transport system permease protein [Paenibacillus shirakamiensis]